jgi:uncharacterized membrane protein YhiD involved in acid resistance
MMMESGVNKSTIVLAGSIVLVGVIFAGVFTYAHQSDIKIKSQQLELEKQKEQAKTDEAKKKEDEAHADKMTNQLQYNSCVVQAESKKDSDLKINSDYETIDENGGVIYHGDISTFNRIDEVAQQEKTRCSMMYQN